MNLYKIEQPEENVDWDTYDSAVVAAESEDDARDIHPDDGRSISKRHGLAAGGITFAPSPEGWTLDTSCVTVTLLAENVALDAGVIVASFNAG